jgi:P27 family predicted phage terminase small subunit
MNKRGPKAKPAQIKAAEGNRGKRAIDYIPTGDALKGKAPNWINADGAREWKRLQAILIPKGLLLERYRGNFEMLCHDYGLFVQCARVVAEGGLSYEMTITSKSGSEYTKYETRPEVVEGRKAQQQYYRRGAAFGLTPSDDGALGLPAGIAESDPMEGALAG